MDREEPVTLPQMKYTSTVLPSKNESTNIYNSSLEDFAPQRPSKHTPKTVHSVFRHPSQELFTCETCVPKTPFAAAVSSDEDKEVGMALGLGLGTALGLALGLGLGLTVAAGAFLAVGLLEMLVPDPQEKGIWV